MSRPCVILSLSGVESWVGAFEGAKRIPVDNRPTTLQPSRELAEDEAKRLAVMHPNCTFLVLEAWTIAKAVKVPSHVTLSGAVVQTRLNAVLAQITDDEVPF